MYPPWAMLWCPYLWFQLQCKVPLRPVATKKGPAEYRSLRILPLGREICFQFFGEKILSGKLHSGKPRSGFRRSVDLRTSVRRLKIKPIPGKVFSHEISFQGRC